MTIWQIGERGDHAAETRGLDTGFSVVRSLMRQHDESHLWPISGRFNATERAIRDVRRRIRNGLVIESPLEYALELDRVISQIVNDENNW